MAVYMKVLARIQKDTLYELDDLTLWFAADETARNRLRGHLTDARNPDKVFRVVFDEKVCEPRVVVTAKDPREVNEKRKRNTEKARQSRHGKTSSSAAAPHLLCQMPGSSSGPLSRDSRARAADSGSVAGDSTDTPASLLPRVRQLHPRAMELRKHHGVWVKDVRCTDLLNRDGTPCTRRFRIPWAYTPPEIRGRRAVAQPVPKVAPPQPAHAMPPNLVRILETIAEQNTRNLQTHLETIAEQNAQNLQKHRIGFWRDWHRCQPVC